MDPKFSLTRRQHVQREPFVLLAAAAVVVVVVVVVLTLTRIIKSVVTGQADKLHPVKRWSRCIV